MVPPGSRDIDARYAFAVPAILAIGLQILLQASAGWPVLNDTLLGPDSYMRLVRVQELFDGAGWWDAASPRSNAPFGETLHWSRAFDLLLAALAAPLMTVMSGREALFIAAGLAGPLLHIAILAALIWATGAILTARQRLFVGLIYAVQLNLLFNLAIGRPDHHGLLLLLWLIELAIVIKMLAGETGRHWPLLAGVVAAISLWVSIEGLFTVALFLAATGLSWLFGHRNRAGRIALYCLVLSVFCAVAIGIEYSSSHWLKPRYDELSVVHVVLFTLLWLFWSICAGLIYSRYFFLRFFVALTGGILSAIVLFVLYPKFFAGPMADVHPRVLSEWFKFNAEVGPLFQFGRSGFVSPLLLSYGLLFIVAFIYAAWQAARVGPDSRPVWLLLAGLLLVTMAMTVLEKRWGGYFHILAAIPIGALLYDLLRGLADRALALRIFGRMFLLLIFMLLPPFAAIVAQMSSRPGTGRGGQRCDVAAMAGFLESRFGGENKIILASNFRGPELLYRTRHRVVATPYHRNASGILDMFDIMRASDLKAARRLIDRRGIELILICPRDGENVTYRSRQGKPASLFDLLEGGRPPAWIVRLTPEDDPEQGFRLFKIDR